MKLFSRILGLSLCVIMALSTLITFSACKDETFKITFMNGASVHETTDVKKDDTVKAPKAPTGTETFRHWYETEPTIPYLFGQKPTGNITLNAYFTTNGQEVVYNYYSDYEDFGQGEEEYKGLLLTLYVNKGTEVKDPSAVYKPSADASLSFKLWKDKTGAQITFPRQAETNLNLIAVMDTTYVVKFATQGGSTIADVPVAANNTVAKPADPTRASYFFDGWVTRTGAAFDFNTPITGNTTIYAKWTYDRENGVPENKMMVIGSSEFDGVFNPYFATSGPDASIYGQTQISMLTSDADGKIDMGHHVPTVAQDYSQITYIVDQDGNTIANPSQDEVEDTIGDNKTPENYYTEYKFLIKNGILFDNIGDGNGNPAPLTIKDVIFNMYVYLDPTYSGSSTLYSTPIVGLAQYQTQNPLATSGSGSSKSVYADAARQRRTNINNYYSSNAATRNGYRQELEDPQYADELAQIFADTQWIRQEFYNELASDWVSARGLSLEEDSDYKSGYKVQQLKTTAEVFAYWHGYITVTYKSSTEMEAKDQSAYNSVIDKLKAVKPNYNEDDLMNAFINTVYNGKLGVYTTAEQNVSLAGYPQIDLTFGTEGNVTGSKLSMEQLIPRFNLTADNQNVGSAAVFSGVSDVAYRYATGTKAIAAWTADEETKALQGNIDQYGKSVPTVEGITVEYVTDYFDGMMTGTEEDPIKQIAVEEEGQYVLCIKIEGVDPKAIWNFGFAVAPMFYYSSINGRQAAGVDQTAWSKIVTDQSDYRSFNYPGVDGYTDTKPTSPGFATHNSTYMNAVLRDPVILRIPRGAGPFKPSNASHEEKAITSSADFYSSNFVYFTANTNFVTTGNEMENVKFKDMRYQVIESTKVLNQLKSTSSGLHYAEVNAKEANLSDANRTSHLTALKIQNNGYGYVGVNASYVPDIYVRRAIMTAMNTALVKTYYGSMAEIINRPMSTNSWAYPENATDAYPYQSEQAAKATVNSLLLESAQESIATYGKEYAYTKGTDGVLYRTNPVTGQRDRLEYTFTIAGAEKDHPAYNMFATAAKILNDIGFKINVYPDSQALSKLASGKLQVWAAAWGSTIDPDMFQIYHMDSQAQSVANWGYPSMLDAEKGTEEERDIIEKLAKQIDEGRSTLIEGQRKSAYERALNLVMELAVEYPTYQRYNLEVYNNTVIDFTSLNSNLTAYSGPMDRIWEVRLIR